MNFAASLCRHNVRLFSKANTFQVTLRNFNTGNPLKASMRSRMGKIRHSENRTPFMKSQTVGMSWIIIFRIIFQIYNLT